MAAFGRDKVWVGLPTTHSNCAFSTSGHAHLACTTGSWCWAVKENITDSYVTNNPCLFSTQNIKKKSINFVSSSVFETIVLLFSSSFGGRQKLC